MNVVCGLTLVANLILAWILYAYSKGDSNMQGVWICTRNDAIGNILVILATVAVYFTQSYIPDLLVFNGVFGDSRGLVNYTAGKKGIINRTRIKAVNRLFY
ncbi:hypothetical protein CEP49_04510 [Mergibacter septicus]|uniref:hypothetical protein n=1 Tax=Mergibacter septicus TaxID=221402 RepID=UPI001178D8A2|nr:hypothetical protein [Mergibacter septicus]AWX13871.1 hypothetical protein CEP49_04510 [Mergibacter septicus]